MARRRRTAHHCVPQEGTNARLIISSGRLSEARHTVTAQCPASLIFPTVPGMVPHDVACKGFTLMNKPPAHNPVNAVLFVSRAKAYVHHKQFERALDDLAEVLRLDPESGDALMVRAAVRVQTGDYRERLADVERRLQMEPPEPVALLTRGNLHACLGEPESAVDFTRFSTATAGHSGRPFAPAL